MRKLRANHTRVIRAREKRSQNAILRGSRRMCRDEVKLRHFNILLGKRVLALIA